MKNTKKITLFGVKKHDLIERPIVNEDIAAGFPSPAEDFKEVRISLDRELVKNESATFYARVRGNSMIDANIEDGDLLVIDRSIESRDTKIAVCMIEGEFTIKRLKVTKDCVYLMPENKNYKAIKVTEENELIIWGHTFAFAKDIAKDATAIFYCRHAQIFKLIFLLKKNGLSF